MEDLELRLQRERDLFLRLLELGQEQNPRLVLEDALALAVDATDAAHGYLEIYADGGSGPEWSIARGCTDAEAAEIRSVTSKGIVAAAIAGGRTIHTPSALLDERFSAQKSVREQSLEAVLCAPIGGAPPVGVLYLQGRPEAGPFSDEDVALVEMFARHAGPVFDRLRPTPTVGDGGDPTSPWRAKLSVPRLVGKSAALAAVLQEVWRAAPLDVTVLITGASGTGKSELARAIHENSRRKDRPFLDLNCAALPEALLESELFGALPGAHSTALQKVVGKLEEADGGTLFLDEIAELSLGAQAKLLKLVQSGEYHPLGGAKASIANVRIIAATNADLPERVREKKFREDLYYRLAVVAIRMPGLQERRGDIPLLAEHVATNAAQKYGLPRLRFSTGARAQLESADWPGHVRQLGHVVESASIRAGRDDAERIEAQHLFPDAAADDGLDASGGHLTFHQATRRFQKSLLAKTLDELEWNIQECARRLDINRSHVYNLINAFGLKRR